MSKKPAAPAIDPEKLYVIAFSRSFEHDGRRFIPRAGQKIRLKGAVVQAIADRLDGYEEA